MRHWKGGLSCWLVRCNPVCPKDVWQLFHPFSHRIIQPLLESIHYDLINSLGLSIPLGVSRGGISICNSQITTVPPKGLAIKLKAIIRDQGFWNPNRIVWFDQKNHEPLSFAVFLASRTTLWEKSKDPCEPWSNCAALRTVTGFWGSDGFFLLQLSRGILGTPVWSYDHI